MAKDTSNQHSSLQRVSRLTPLRAILALIESRVSPVKARKCATAAAAGFTLADDVVTAERVRSEMNFDIHRRLREAGLRVPYPK